MNIKTQIIIAVDLVFMIAMAVSLVRITSWLAFHEPNYIVARSEFALSIFYACWFAWQIPYWIIKVRRLK